MADRAAARRLVRRLGARRWVVLAGLVVVLAGIAAGAWAATRPAGPSYRTAVAGAGDVTNTLNATGTVRSASQATVSFPVSGLVSGLDVTAGQPVTAGQTLAQLDTTNLANQVSSEQSTLASAQAKLAGDQNSQTATTSTSPSTAVNSTANTSTGGRAGSTGQSSAATRKLGADQAAVVGGQHQVDTDLAATSADLKQAAASCQSFLRAGSAKAAPAADPITASSPDTTTTTDPTTTTTPPVTTTTQGAGSTQWSACAALTQRVLDDQTRTAADEKSLAGAEAALNTALGQAAAAQQSAGSSAAGSASKGTSSAGTSSGGRSTDSSGGGSQGPASAAQLAADQASVDAANAELAAGQQNLAAASLVSPIDGTVAQVNMVTGQAISANSSTATIEIVGPGTDQVTTTVGDIDLRALKVGQHATVTPDGTAAPINGTVISIGALGSSSSGSTTYPVTIALTPTDRTLFVGSAAAVSITLGSTHATVTVPTSAVHTVGGFSFVSRLKGGTVTNTRVTLGVVGATATQISSGLAAGDQVVLADLSTPLPTANANPLRGIGGGGFGGGGGGGAVRASRAGG